MNRKALRYLLLPLILIVGISAAKVDNDRLFEIAKNIELFVNVYKELNANYVDDIDPNQLMKTGIDAMVGSLDPYTNYISESQVEGYRINEQGKYQGIGAVVERVGEQITIIEPYEGSPVLEAGLQAGDQIISIDGIATADKTQEDLSKIVRGVPGTTLMLKVTRPGGFENQQFEITRGEVKIPNVPYSGEIAENIGYISLTTFTPDASKNVSRALKNMKRDNENLQGVILDLRFNGGGLLREAIGVSNIFVPKDLDIVSVKGKVIDRDVSYKTRQPSVDLDIPLVVLINKNSASASEIVSGVIQDLDRGVLIGQRSFGKGLVQNTKDLGYNSRIKVTTSKYYIPSGRCIQSVEYENGEPKDIPDEMRAKFRTRGGRTVLDGGGVSPDIKLEPKPEVDVIEALKKDKIIFSYVTEYMKNSTVEKPELEAIEYTDYEGFKMYLTQNKFSFESSVEQELKDLKALDTAMFDAEIAALESKIQVDKRDDIDQYKTDIQKLIEIEIATRHYLQKGKTYQSLKTDTEIDEAVKVLLDSARYTSILK